MANYGAMSLAKASDRESLRVDGYALRSIKHLSKAKRSKAAGENLDRFQDISRHFKTLKREQFWRLCTQGFRHNQSTLQSHGQENLPWLDVMAAPILPEYCIALLSLLADLCQVEFFLKKAQ